MDIGREFVTKLVDDGQLNLATRSGITVDFLDDDSASIYKYILRHFNEYKQVPSRDAVLKTHPNFDFEDAIEPLEFYIHQLQEAKRREILEDALLEASQNYQQDTGKAEHAIRTALSELQIAQKTFQDVNVAESALEYYSLYEERLLNPGANGILSKWPTLDYQTLGWQPEEFICLVGEKWMGKSWIMIWLATQAALQGERVVFVTKEMSQQAIVKRLHSILAQVEYDALRRGELSNVERKRYAEKMAEIASSNFHFIIARTGVNTVDDVKAKAIEQDATILFGDSIYLFPPDETTQVGTETNKRLLISQKCKAIAKELGIPFIVSIQAGRRKTKERIPGLDDIEWSNAFSQDADTVFFLHKDEVDRDIGRAQVHLLKSREGDLAQFYIHQNFQYMNFDESGDQMTPTTNVFEDGEGLFDEGIT